MQGDEEFELDERSQIGKYQEELNKSLETIGVPPIKTHNTTTTTTTTI